MAARPWYKADPAFFVRVQEDTLAEFPELSCGIRNGRVVLAGPLRLLHDGEEVDRYEIEVELPDDFPNEAPEVYEIGGRIRPVADDHAYASGRVCLFVPGERWRYWPVGSTLADFLRGPVRSHFIGHAHYELTGRWPFGERQHGPEGVFEAYAEMLGVTDRSAILSYLDVLAHQAPKGHWSCPCGSGRRLRDCHAAQVADLRMKITVAEAQRARLSATGGLGRPTQTSAPSRTGES